MVKGPLKLGWTREQVWKGSLLATIAHAIMVAHFPEIANEHSWDDMNYSVQDSSGTRGTITFHSKYCVGAFRNEHSSRITSGEVSATQYLKGAPLPVIQLAEEETLQYLLDTINGEVTSVITTAFWGVENHLFMNDEYELMIENGGFILAPQVLEISAAIGYWIDYYEMNAQQVILMNSIYERKVSNPEAIITLSSSEVDMIGTTDKEGLTESEISFKEIGVNF